MVGSACEVAAEADGLLFRKEREGCGEWEGESDCGVIRREVRDERVLAFWARVVRRARLRACVLRRVRRSVRIDSGVGAEGGRGRGRFWGKRD